MDPAPVAGREPAIGGQELVALLADIAEHQRVAFDFEFAFHAFGEHLPAFGIDDAVLHARGGWSVGADHVVGQVMDRRGVRSGSLGHAERAAEHLVALAQERRDGCHEIAAEDRAEVAPRE